MDCGLGGPQSSWGAYGTIYKPSNGAVDVVASSSKKRFMTKELLASPTASASGVV